MFQSDHPPRRQMGVKAWGNRASSSSLAHLFEAAGRRPSNTISSVSQYCSARAAHPPRRPLARGPPCAQGKQIRRGARAGGAREDAGAGVVRFAQGLCKHAHG